MKVNHINDATKIFLIAATTIITCLIVAIGMSQLNTARDLSATALEQMSLLNNELSNSELKMYDDSIVMGSEVVNFIKKHLGDYDSPDLAPLYVYVKTTTSENTYVNGDYILNLSDFTDATHYIKPIAKFTGTIYKNENDVILGVGFIQK